MTSGAPSVQAYLRSAKGFHDLLTSNGAAFLVMLPVEATFGALGAGLARGWNLLAAQR